MKDYTELSPIKETGNDFEELEKRIKDAFRRIVYLPLMRRLSDSKTLANAKENALRKALSSGRVIYYRGAFVGEFNASISKQLKELGAKWDSSTSSFRLSLSQLPEDFRKMVRDSTRKNKEKIEKAQKKLAQILPADIADLIKSDDVFAKALWKTDEAIAKTLKAITIVPKLSSEDREKIAKEWQTNMDLYIKDFADEKIPQLRADIQKISMAGGRRKEIEKLIESSYAEVGHKAKFLARQETSLLMTKYKETRYTKVGVTEYKWGCVTGTSAHPVRPDHRKLGDESKNGKIFRWDDPPVTNSKTQARNNPGQDYNCRCFAIPVVRFNKGTK